VTYDDVYMLHIKKVYLRTLSGSSLVRDDRRLQKRKFTPMARFEAVSRILLGLC
jgi:hypothetical protein